MASYPNSIFSPRARENRSGVVYDPAKKTVLFAEDVDKGDAETVAVETELGAGASRPLPGLKTPLSDKGLILYLPFDENTGTTAYDKSFYGNNGTFKGAGEPAWSEGHKNVGVNFDGVNDFVQVPVTYVNATEWSLSIWAYKDSYIQYQVLYSDYTSGNKNIMCGYETIENAMFFYASTGGTTYSTSIVGVWLANEWAHWVFVFKGGTYIRIYKNGVMIQERTDGVPASIAAVHNDRYFGRFSTYYFDGKIDEPRMYLRALSANEVMARYLKG